MITVAASLSILVLAQVGFYTPEDARQALEEGQSIERRVSRSIAVAAVDRIGRVFGPEELEVWVAIAQAGNAHDELIPALGALVERLGPTAPAAVKLLAKYPREARAPLLVRVAEGRNWQYALEQLAGSEDDGLAAQAAVELLAPRVGPREFLALFGRWSDGEEYVERARRLLQVVAETTERPKETLTAFAGLADLPAELSTVFDQSVLKLARRDPETANAALDLVRMGTYGPRAVLVRALGELAPAHWERADEVLLDIVESGRGEALAPAIAAAAKLRMPVLPSLLPTIATEQEFATEARVAAIAALAEVGVRDRGTMSLFTSLLDDASGAVRAAAYRALVRKSGGARLPARAAAWQGWIARARLPDEPAEPHEERLLREREALQAFWTR